MKLLDQFFDVQEKIYKCFEYEEDWHYFPFDDLTDRYWMVKDNQLLFADKAGKLKIAAPQYIYHLLDKKTWESFDGKWVMLKCDTKLDNNKVLAILDATKRRT